ncbi:MAG: DNA/RNA non-specific endonuclease [Myxococcota bacterium]
MSIEEGALRRVRECNEQQMESIAAVRRGTPLAAEPEPERAAERVLAEARLAPVQTTVFRLDAPSSERVFPTPEEAGPERIWGPTRDFVGVAFLERGMAAARTVGRVSFRDGRANGTGFLVAPGVFLTNNHVLESERDCLSFVAEFDYETDVFGRPREVCRFEFDPGALFVTDDRDDLDYTVVAIGAQLSGGTSVRDFGASPLSDASNKHSLGEVANIVQHPDGRLKEVVLRENRLVSRLSHVLHYVADTEPGSSGAPVFNNQWQAIALHHWGGPWRQDRGPDGLPVPRFVNEGIRISAIVDELRAKRGDLGAAQRALLTEVLGLGESTSGLQVGATRGDGRAEDERGAEVRADGTAVWRVPIEISVAIPGAFGRPSAAPDTAKQVVVPAEPGPEAFRRTVNRNYENRRGYRAEFLKGHRIPLPGARHGVLDRLAANLQAEPGDDPFEFAYEHFSVYVDGVRGLPLVTACNIDGKSLKSINRKTGEVSRAEALVVEAESGPEAREKWYDDPRIDPSLCGNDSMYTSQRVSPGRNRLGRIFHRGHMVRRLDPCWGSDARALRAEADTFHFTNCTPQVGSFNSRTRFWQGIENHVLDSARSDDLRLCVFTGPVLDDDDPPYREDVFEGFRVPLQFWKIVVWSESGDLSALALLADQSPLLREVPEAAEAIDDTTDIDDFISTVPEIEALTGLDFGKSVERADIHETVPESARKRSESEVREEGVASLALSRRSRGKSGRKGKGGRS